ncbi:MAG: sulfatase-like hydrolase/transferase [Myxococcaceae bacterium]|nr:sulfatase-like hydrolase/transferase [Myxococcaceae bacterium]MCA3015838.1 sulfatase-like hydrolase/transferase [Myxococcaceae bacterium]
MTSPWFDRAALRRGLVAALWALSLLAVSAVPSRLSSALFGWGTLPAKVVRVIGGAWLDLAAALLVVTPFVLLLGLVGALVPHLRRPFWQRAGGLVATAPFGFSLWVFTVTAQEVKSERGSFPTIFDLGEGGTNASFIEGTVGFLGYERIRTPALVGVALTVALLVLALRRRPTDVASWRGWSLGFSLGFLAGALVLVTGQTALARVNRFSPAALGDPLTGLIESAVDLVQHQGPTTARGLVLGAVLPTDAVDTGAALVGWPATDGGCTPHPFARPLDRAREPATSPPRGSALVAAFEDVSRSLFAGHDGGVSVFFVSLEGFRADDVHALNPQAPRALAPFTTSLYERAATRGSGVLASRAMLQAGVRTAHNLGAMTCGVGTLPYNLAFIRDLQPFPLRCLSDVLADSGFEHRFFYGSDATFDEMHHFLPAHRYVELVSQRELPRHLPKGTWEAVTDFAVFDEAVTRVEAAARAGAPQFALLMSLSNHSPFTAPEDLPPEVKARVERALTEAPHHADADDVRRLVAFSYTDAAVERLLAHLDASGLADRALVVLMADHSTGHAYVWGAEATETDAQKAQVPFALVVPPRLRARLSRPEAFDEALARAQALIDAGPVSLNDVPTLVLALLSAHPGVVALPAAQRWHTLGGQLTSPHFRPGPGATLLSINGVSELFAVGPTGQRVGDYQDSVFLKTRADRYRVTPALIPITATLQHVMRCAPGP